jgi:MacB-like periplasmic core domain
VSALVPARLRPADLGRVASVGLRTRRMRAALSALGVAIGVAAIVAVLGLSSSSQAGLLAEIDRLGTNLLTVEAGQSFTGETAELPLTAPATIGRIGAVEQVAHTGTVDAGVYRSPLIPSVETNALHVQAASLDLLPVIATAVAQGSYLNPPPRPSRSPCSARSPGAGSGSTASTRAHGSGSTTSGSTSPGSSSARDSRRTSTPACSSATRPRSATSTT